AEGSVIPGGGAAFRHGKADGAALAGSATAGGFFRRDAAASALVHGRASGGLGGGAVLLELVFGAEAVVGVGGSDELFGGGAVEIEALRLVIGAFIPVESQPAHAHEDAFHHFLGGALKIGVFDAQDERAAGVASVEPVEERSAGAA